MCLLYEDLLPMFLLFDLIVFLFSDV